MARAEDRPTLASPAPDVANCFALLAKCFGARCELLRSIAAVDMRPAAARARSPYTFWDFVSLMPKSTHMIMWAMSDGTLPRSHRVIADFVRAIARHRHHEREMDPPEV